VSGATGIFARVTLPLAAVNFLNQASRAVLAVIGPILAVEFALSASDLGLLAALLFVAYAAAQLPGGLALDLFGPRRVQATMALVAGAGFLLCAVATGPTMLGLGRMLTGLGVAAGLTALLKANTQWFPRHRVAAMTGCALLVGAMGGLAVTLPLQALLPSIGWRGGFGLLAGLSVVVSLWIWLSVPDRPPGAVPPPRRGLGAEIRAFGPIFAHPVFRRFVPAIAVLSALNFTYQGLWAGPWLRDVAGLDGGGRATILFLYACGMASGSFVTGQLASLGQARGASPLLIPFAAMGLQFVIQLWLALAPPSGMAALGLAWFAFAIAGSAGPAGYAAIGQSFGAELAGRVATAINASMLVLVFVLQYGIGQVLDLWPRNAADGWDARGYGWALAATLLLQALVVLWAWRGAPRMSVSSA
jgi:MFS family permease